MNKAIKIWKDHLYRLEKNDEVLIVSGEAYYRLYQELKGDMISLHQKSKLGVKFVMISGPLMSIDKNKSNPIIDLVKEDIIELYIAPYRQVVHYVVFGEKAVYREDYHAALSNNRDGQIITDSVLIAKYRFDFFNLIAVLNMTRFSNDNEPVFLTDNEIQVLQNKFRYKFDFIDKRLLNQCGISQR